MSFEYHKDASTQFANFYDGVDKYGKPSKINKTALNVNANPDIVMQFKARLMYLTGGYPVSQKHIYPDAIIPTLNGLFNNINRELRKPDSPLYDGLGITKEQVVTSNEFADTVCKMASENRYKNKYITETQIANRIEKIYGHKFAGYPNPTFVRKVDLEDYHSSYNVKGEEE